MKIMAVKEKYFFFFRTQNCHSISIDFYEVEENGKNDREREREK
jgi:hypothetical protein